MIRQTRRIASGLAAALVISGCSSAPPTDDGTANAQPVNSSRAEELPPPGYGTLRQDDFTVALQSGAVQLKVTPLAESVIRLAAPDTYQRLHRLVESRSTQIRDLAQRNGLRQDPLVFSVSFFTRDVQIAFDPTDLVVLSRGILFRPMGIIPLTPDWGREQLKQEQLQQALYLFDPAIDLNVFFQVEYGGVIANDWAAVISRLEAERGRVMSRARG
jgi:hypothetical protein